MTESVSELLMLTYDQIDYSSLSVDTLAGLSLGGDPYIASMALPELELRDPRRLVETAWQLVQDPREDDDLQAFAVGLITRNSQISDGQLNEIRQHAGPLLSRQIGVLLDGRAEHDKNP